MKTIIHQYEQRTDITFSTFLKKRGLEMIPVRASSLRLKSVAEEQAPSKKEAEPDVDDEALMDAD